jgi:glucose-6-phosphate dehydrogenase assembly protein OpcA
MNIPSAENIESDLTGLWDLKNGSQKQTSGIKRIFTTNLVAYASDHEDGYRVEDILGNLMAYHPGRYILVRPAADPTEPPLRYYVSGRCLYWADPEKRVCCDMVKLVAQKEVIENLYGFTFSLLVPDLPVEFWWPGDMPYHNSFFEHMAQQLSRVWVDSSQFKDPVQSVGWLAAFWHQHYPGTNLADMNWIRIQRWQALVAELFDGEGAKHLKNIRQVTIEYGEGSTPLRSFYLASWMATQLGWSHHGSRIRNLSDPLVFDSPRGLVEVILKPIPDPEDLIFAVGIMTEGEQPAIFTLARDEDPRQVIVRSEINHRPVFSRVATLEHLQSDDVLAIGLKHFGVDWVWKKTLAMMGTILAYSEESPVEKWTN